MNARVYKGSKEDWNGFVMSSPSSSFLQSWEWGELQRALGFSFWRLVVEKDDEIQASAMVIRRTLPGGYSWLYVPHGPIVSETASARAWPLLIAELEKLGRDSNSVFIRIEPKIVRGSVWMEQEVTNCLHDSGFRKADHNVQPRHTVVVDLEKPEKNMQAAMHPKTRYNIRLAQKRGVNVRFSGAEKDIETFLQLSRHVSGRSSFRYHPDDYYRLMCRELAPAGMLQVGIAEHKGKPLAAHVLIYYGNLATYAHGASASKGRALMGPHLLQWESMLRAKERGCTGFDLFGVAPSDAEADHPWAGITRFKEGFGGQRVDYIGAYDLALQSAWYWTYTVARKAKAYVR